MIPDELTVLLVEDNPGDARLLQEHFRDAEHAVTVVDDETTEAPSGDGVTLYHCDRISTVDQRLADVDFDIILLDLNLPGSHGLETVDYVRDRTSTTPIIVLTGVPEERLGIDAVSHGAQDYLVKDEVTPEVLLRAIRYAIERKKTEEKLRRQTEELRILNQLTRHDIRNEMTLVVGRARELAEHVDYHGESQLDEIIRTSNHILQLTRSIGDIVSTVTRTEADDLSPVALKSVLESEVESVRRLYDGGSIEIRGEIPPVDVRANDLLSSVFANLFSNAILYNDKETPRVTLWVETDDDEVTVSVADNGPGIPDRRKETIFGEGEQGPESSGTGIGLYLVNQLVAQYGGDVWVEDNDPEGSVFHVTLDRLG
ncbi:Signal transduction histidine kinase [Halogranum rubrum]|uniref:histidine kinase n=1 Tax=Halogranum rubrum TaxID=553466 RepID=A0A1I4III8_9EURY|nr:ATP-binding protein [Halogranum rubrum]SFL54104.1 Signal transduction histidine kinase [Halogranum rubrum]